MDPVTTIGTFVADLQGDVTTVAVGAVGIGLGVFALRYVVRVVKKLVAT